jgi:hypothetical protein
MIVLMRVMFLSLPVCKMVMVIHTKWFMRVMPNIREWCNCRKLFQRKVLDTGVETHTQSV